MREDLEPLTIPSPSDEKFPRLIRNDALTIEALEQLRADPDLIPAQLVRAIDYLRARAPHDPAAALLSATVLTLALNFVPEVDFTMAERLTAEEMVERAARALYAWHNSESAACRYWDHGVGFDKAPWRSQARAALSAAAPEAQGVRG